MAPVGLILGIGIGVFRGGRSGRWFQGTNRDELVLVELGGSKCVECRKVRITEVILVNGLVGCECTCQRNDSQGAEVPIVRKLGILGEIEEKRI